MDSDWTLVMEKKLNHVPKGSIFSLKGDGIHQYQILADFRFLLKVISI